MTLASSRSVRCWRNARPTALGRPFTSKVTFRPSLSLRWYGGWSRPIQFPACAGYCAYRSAKAADAEWDEFDFEDALWRRPAAKMKARRDHVSPLSAQVIAVLKDLQCITGGGRYLSPHRSGKGFTTLNRLTYAMRDMNLGRGTTPHCWRTTFSTWANENGFQPDAIERQLAHVESNKVRATYNKALLLDLRRFLLLAWANYLFESETGRYQ